MNRRKFFSMLAGLPFVGAMFERQGVSADIQRMWREAGLDKPIRSVFPDQQFIGGVETSTITWIPVEEQLPDLDDKWQEWADGENPQELITIGKMSRRVLISHGTTPGKSCDFGFYVQGRGDLPEWVIPDRHGGLWVSAITHWAHLPTQPTTTKPQRESAWKKLRDVHLDRREEMPPEDERCLNWSVTFHAIKEKSPMIGKFPLLLAEPGRTYTGLFSERTPETTHWAHMPKLPKTRKAESC